MSIERKKMIEQPGKKKMLLFSGSSNDELAQKVASNLGTQLSDVERKELNTESTQVGGVLPATPT